MSNLTLSSDDVPPLDQEHPIAMLNGFMLANPAWHARLEDLWPPKAGEEPPTPEIRRSVELYLANFCRPVRNIANQVSCVACNELLTTPYATDARSSFGRTYLKIDKSTPNWEGRCGSCGYPVRSRHVIVGQPPLAPQPVVKLDFFPMCYHPKATERGGL